MKNYYFIKLYHEILHDPKMGRLSDATWRRCIELFLMAGEKQEDGILPDWKDICWHFRHISEEQLAAEFEELRAVEILHQKDDQWIVTKFAIRQAHITSADRQKAYRNRERDKTASTGQNGQNVTTELQDSNASVTTRNAEVRSKSRDIDTTTTSAQQLATFYQQQTENAPNGVTDSQMWEDDCLCILDLAGDDFERGKLLVTEAIIILEKLEYTHKSPGSLIKTIERQLKKSNKKRNSNGNSRSKKNEKSKASDAAEQQQRHLAEARKAIAEHKRAKV